MADEPDDQLPQSPQSDHEGQPQADNTGPNKTASVGHGVVGEGQPNRAEKMRESRARKSFIKQMCKDLGINEDVAIKLAEHVELLRPSAERMSTNADVAARLAEALKQPFGNRNPLIKPKGTGLDCSISKADGKRNLTESPLGDILKSEQELLHALIINERIRGGLEAQVTEHDSAGRMLMAEFVRRHHIHETWRHMVPKGFMPLISALIAADVKYDDIKLNSALLNALLDAITDWYLKKHRKDVEYSPQAKDKAKIEDEGQEQTINVFRFKKALQEAAKATEEELLATMREGFAASAAPEDFAAMQNRLAEEISQLQQRIEAPMAEGGEPVDDGVLADVKSRLEQLQRIKMAGGGIDKDGRVVFQSPEAFVGVSGHLEEPAVFGLMRARRV